MSSSLLRASAGAGALLLASLAACDFGPVVGAHVPVLAPVRAECLSAGVYQVLDRDSSVYLEYGVIHLHKRLEPGQAEPEAMAYASMVQRARDVCGSRSPDHGPSLTLVSDDPPFVTSSVGGTGGRVWIRAALDSVHWHWLFRSGGRHVLRVDTLATLGSGQPELLPVQRLLLPELPRHHLLAIDCVRGDSTGTGRLAAVVRSTNAPWYTQVTQAWELDTATLRLEPTRTSGIRCRRGRGRWQGL